VAGLLAGARITGTPLAAQRVVILGAGAAGIGIARLMRDTFRRGGLAGEDLTRAIANLDSHGLVVDDMPITDEHKRDFAWPSWHAEWFGLGKDEPRDLLAVVRALKPTMLIGTSGEPGTFTEEVVREMATHVERPLIFPMSNPTSKSEAVPEDIIKWTDGRALIATGSPFDPVPWNGRTLTIGQGNNAFVFPGMGLGILISKAREVTDSMFAAAARQLAAEVSAEDLASGSLFPPVRDIRRVTAGIAAAVVREARDCGVGDFIQDADVEREVARAMWDPAYLPLEPAPAVAAAQPELAAIGR
jgi:malate dehydrogenase (oxaloacetate-decarboxylating)